MAAGQWLQTACDRFANLSGLLRLCRWIRGRFGLWCFSTQFNRGTKRRLKLIVAAEYDTGHGRIFEEPDRDALNVRGENISESGNLLARWRQFVSLNVKPCVRD